ncbi:MFS transporter [Micromonospora sp. NPDC126480]|uniref:MFS transporter n=1 Tax=Micromonospora sp. NPDC126480 TaxID=3155312 RepID=UPI00332EC4A4
MTVKRPAGFAAFTILWAGQLVSTLGTRMTNFALSIWIWQETGRASDLALMTFCAFASTVLFSPIAGALIDRWRRRLTIALSDAGAAVFTLLLLVLFLADAVQVWHLYLVNLATGAFLAFQVPTYSATVALMMEKQHYPRANAMLSLARSVPGIFAPAAAAAVLAAGSVETVLLIDVLSCAVALVTVVLVAIPQPPRQEKHLRVGIWRDSLHGFGYIRRRPSLLALQGILFSIGLFAAMGWILLTPMVLARTDNNESAVATVLSIGAVGGVVGATVLGVLKPTRRKMLRLLTAIIVFSLLGRVLLGTGDSLVIWAFAWSCAWFCIPFIDGYGESIWQEKVSPTEQGRVFATRQLIDNLAVPIALGVAGPLADFVLEPAMAEGGSLATVFGGLVGTGPGAGMALIFFVTGLLGVGVAIAGFAVRRVRDVESLVPDHDAPEPTEPVPAGPGPDEPTLDDPVEGDPAARPARSAALD